MEQAIFRIHLQFYCSEDLIIKEIDVINMGSLDGQYKEDFTCHASMVQRENLSVSNHFHTDLLMWLNKKLLRP